MTLLPNMKRRLRAKLSHCVKKILPRAALLALPLLALPHYSFCEKNTTTQSLPEVRAEFSMFSMALDQESNAIASNNPLSGSNLNYRKEEFQEIESHLQSLQSNPVLPLYPGLAEAIRQDIAQLEHNKVADNASAITPIHQVSDFIHSYIKSECHKDYSKLDIQKLDNLLNIAQRGNYAGLYCSLHHKGYNDCRITPKTKCDFLVYNKKPKKNSHFVMVLDYS